MDNKYYTPSISDLFEGYIFETQIYCEDEDKYLDEWEMHEFDSRDGLRHDLTCQFEEGTVRVQYLTPEDIEGEGWVYHHSVMLIEDNLVFIKIFPNKLKIELQFSPTEHHIGISKEYYGKDSIKLSKSIYVGRCLSINELRKLEKMLGI